MDLSKFIIFDIEADGLDPTKIYCLSIAYIKDGKLVVKTTTNYDTMRMLLSKEDGIYVGHNIINWDIPAAIEKILGITIKGVCIDTLYLSWYLYPEMRKHGLEVWGEFFGVPKPKIDDWYNLTTEEYIHRCEEDVKINIRLFLKQMRYMKDLYKDQEEVVRFLRYLMFKANCVTHQLKSRWKLDVERCVNTLEDFKNKKEEKVAELIEIMPKIPVKRVRKYPRQMLKKDGTYTVAGQAWVDTLKERDLPDNHTEDIVYVHSYLDSNPNSSHQVKKWLYDLGWKPETFKYFKEDNGDVRKVEQVRTEGTICDSVKKLMKKEPRLDALEGLTVLSHRIGMLQGFLNNASPDGYIRAEIQGLTNTLRFRHKVAVNLPGVTGKGDISDGAHIRGCLIAPEGYELCGSDMSSLEDRTKQHFMWKYDPEYVKEMMVDDFDPHMSLAQFASALTQEDIDLFHDIKKRKKKGEEILKEILTRFDTISGIRHEYKTANYACLPTDNTEVLTIDGWKSRGELKIGDKVVSYNGTFLKEDTIINIVDFKNMDTILMYNNNWRIESTPDHRWVGKKRSRANGYTRYIPYESTTEKINSDFNITNSAEYLVKNKTIHHSIYELIGFILSDGYVGYSEGKYLRCSISQSKKKYYKKVKDLLDSSGIKYSEYLNNSNVSCFQLRSKDFKKLWEYVGLPLLPKHKINYEKWILQLNIAQRSDFIRGFFMGDGHTRRGKKVITQNDGRISDAIQLALFLSGEKISLSSHKKGTNNCRDITIHSNQHTTGQKLKKEYSRKTDVFCITTNNSTFVCRQGNTITITGNCVYGAGIEALARGLNISKKRAANIIEAYWKRNWSVKKVAEDCKVKEINGQKWLFNPISRFWYSLRYDKDRFSTLNQGSGVYCFDTWIKYVVSKGKWPIGQFHDEIVLCVKEGYREQCERLLKWAIEMANKELRLNRELDVDVQFGENYAQIH